MRLGELLDVRVYRWFWCGGFKEQSALPTRQGAEKKEGKERNGNEDQRCRLQDLCAFGRKLFPVVHVLVTNGRFVLAVPGSKNEAVTVRGKDSATHRLVMFQRHFEIVMAVLAHFLEEPFLCDFELATIGLNLVRALRFRQVNCQRIRNSQLDARK